MQELGVPGVAFSLIDSGKVVFEGGLGVRELGKRAEVDKDTLFIAASNTKGLTTLLLARLVDARKLDWDEPVVKVYPSFKLGDAETTKHVLVKHLAPGRTASTSTARRQWRRWTSTTASSRRARRAALGRARTTSRST
jgi:CubicO group peptidase (beta-lactamase class C family)